MGDFKSRRVKSLLSTASRDEALAGTQVKIAATIAAIDLIGGPSVDGLRRSTRCATESRAWAQRSWKVVQASALRKRMSAIPPIETFVAIDDRRSRPTCIDPKRSFAPARARRLGRRGQRVALKISRFPADHDGEKWSPCSQVVEPARDEPRAEFSCASHATKAAISWPVGQMRILE
jgi:hypothetical protein